MAVATRSHVTSLAVSVVATAVAMGMLALALTSPLSNIKPFLFTASGLTVAAVATNVFLIVKNENDKKEARNKLKNLDPKFCPDYWTNMHDSCNGQMCKPVFEETGGTVYMSSAFSTQGTPIKQVRDMNSDGVCETRSTRRYPWLEIDNSCDARERKL